MSLIAYIIFLAIEGLIVGALARLALPGRDPMTVPQTIGIGMAGSFIAGVIGLALVGHTFGFVIAVLVSTGLVYAVRRSRGGRVTSGPPPRDRLRR